jgi:DNA-binding NtrC family response regulator
MNGVDLGALGRICVVDDDDDVRVALERTLARAGHEVLACESALETLRNLEEGRDGRGQRIDVIITDMRMPVMDGLQLLERLRDDWPDVPAIMLTADDSAQVAVRALRNGAYDYLTKPISSNEQLLLTVARAISHGRLLARTKELQRQLDLGERWGGSGVVGNSPAMRDVFRLVESVAPTDATILLRGESGTGKELLARAIHARSRRAARPFIAINSSSLSETLLESELFGHVRGAFTGANTSRVGLFEEASGGTLFLDEIGDISANLQVRLLRVLQEGEIRPVGAGESRRVDVRVVAATNRDLEAAVQAGQFRRDLYYRLNVVPLQLPPLRERREDLVLLAQHFVHGYAKKHGKAVSGLSLEAVDTLGAHDWPGNIRELENVIQYAVILATGPTLGPADLRLPRGLCPAVASAPCEAPLLPPPPPVPRPDTTFAKAKLFAVSEFERHYVAQMLERASGNVTEAARRAGLDKANFRRLMRRNGVSSKPRN